MNQTPQVTRAVSRRLGAVLALAALMVSTLATVVSAAPGVEFSIPIDTIVREPEGSTTLLASVDVSGDAIGQECTAQAVAENPGSVHPGNDLLVDSGTSQIVIPDVESVSPGVTEGVGTLVLGPTITVSLLMGPDEVFSGGFTVNVTCMTIETTTTTVQETTTTTPETTTTTVQVTTTTVEVSESTVTTQPETSTTTVEDEVLGTEVLPFTGSDSGWTIWVAIVLGAMGVLLVLSSQRVEE